MRAPSTTNVAKDGSSAAPEPPVTPPPPVAAGGSNGGIPQYPAGPPAEPLQQPMEPEDDGLVTDVVTDEELLSEMDVVGVTQIMVEHLTRNLKQFYGKNFLEIFMNVSLLPIQLVCSAILTPIFVAIRTVVSVILLVCYGALKLGWTAGAVSSYVWRESNLDKLADAVALIAVNIFFREDRRPANKTVK